MIIFEGLGIKLERIIMKKDDTCIKIMKQNTISSYKFALNYVKVNSVIAGSLLFLDVRQITQT